MGNRNISQGVLNVSNSAELLSYVINQTPVLRESEEIDLPKQGESIAPYGKIIMQNERYKNAFLNTMNLIGLTVITRNTWENPWKVFVDKGELPYGQQIREIVCDIANVYDYNDMVDRVDGFLKTEVPDVLSYLHQLNYQKFYKTTTSDEQMSMAFETGDLFKLIDIIVASLYEGYEYDMYLMAKYMLRNRLKEGTITAIQIENFANKTDRDIVAEIKGVSNDMTFRSPKFNPAGLRKATAFDDQFAIVSTKFDAKFTTNVLATSYFRSDAEMKAHMELCDGFGNFDLPRLREIFAKRDNNGDIIPNEYVEGYDEPTAEEMAILNNIPALIVDRDFFQVYRQGINNQGLKSTEFFNPQTLRRNHWLHVWGVLSTSPFANAVVFTQTAQAVSSVVVSPSTATVSKGQELQLSAVTTTTGFANKAVAWSQDGKTGATIDQTGKLKIASSYDSTGSGTAGVWDIEIKSILATGDVLDVNGVKYTVGAEDDTIAKQITALKSALNTATITDDYTVGGTQPHCTLTEKSGKYGLLPEPVITLTKASGSTGAIDVSNTTEGEHAGNIIVVTATSIYDNTKSGTAVITIA